MAARGPVISQYEDLHQLYAPGSQVAGIGIRKYSGSGELLPFVFVLLLPEIISIAVIPTARFERIAGESGAATLVA